MSTVILSNTTDLTKRFPYVREWRQLPNGVLVHKYNVGGAAPGVIDLRHDALEPYAGHNSFTFVEAKGGKQYGYIRMRPPPDAALALPVGSDERTTAVRAHYESMRALEQQYVREAFPEDFQ